MNLFKLAETQLVKEKVAGQRKGYTLMNIVEYGIRIRKYLDLEARGEAISRGKRNNNV